jgi:hypothetical protein
MNAPSTPTKHVWQFFRAGGLDQVRLETGDDLASLRQLDPKLWIALACPTTGLEFDQRTLELVDTDKDGRIRVPEILAAAEWALSCLKHGNTLAHGDAPLALADIATDKPEGTALLAAAKQILAALGKPDATTLSVADVADLPKIYAKTLFNGDGIIPAEAAPDPATKQAIADIIATFGSKPDRSGLPGVDADLATTFFADAQALADWGTKADQSANPSAGILFLGDRTTSAYGALQAVRTKIDDYFNRCHLAAFDHRAANYLNRTESELAALAAKDMSTLGADIAALPLAQVGPGRPLSLVEGINPAWASAIATFRSHVVAPILGIVRTSLTESEWHEVVAKFEPHAAWIAAKPASPVEKLGSDRIRELLLGSAREEIARLIARDAALAPELAAIDAVERLVRYHRDLARLLANFANFADFYDPARPAVFQCGTLYLDSRHCDLCVPVADAAAHAAVAAMSKCYIAYCDLRRPGLTSKIAAIFSNGDADYLMVGRNGLFVDRKGRDWDATITRIVDNPISIRQAFWSPYKKFIRLIEEQVAKRAAAAESASDAKLAGAATSAANADKAAPAKPAEPKKFDLALITGIGVALGSIGTMLAAIFAKVLDLAWWQYPLVLVAIVLLISLPSMLIAALKLRQRTLGPVLEANGWAINGRVKINIPLGTSFTAIAKLPPGARRSLEDPFEDKAAARARRRMLLLLLLAALAAAAVWIHIDRNRHGGKYIWEDRTPPAPQVAAPAAPAPAKAP